uniref:Uncharacterized protein n=1 Tax=Chrysotila carterae TaxID=13221 RepID=A0A7S4BMD8_CHRCT|eukprot:6190497-Pleurochrysis_carterae.AAC.1
MANDENVGDLSPVNHLFPCDPAQASLIGVCAAVKLVVVETSAAVIFAGVSASASASASASWSKLSRALVDTTSVGPASAASVYARAFCALAPPPARSATCASLA